MEVTPKTLADVKGGTLISYEGRVQVYNYHPFLMLFHYNLLMFCQKHDRGFEVSFYLDAQL